MKNIMKYQLKQLEEELIKINENWKKCVIKNLNRKDFLNDFFAQ